MWENNPHENVGPNRNLNQALLLSLTRALRETDYCDLTRALQLHVLGHKNVKKQCFKVLVMFRFG